MGAKGIPIETRERNPSSWEEFEEQLEDIRRQIKSQLFFRGQSDSKWQLSSTLDRERVGRGHFSRTTMTQLQKPKLRLRPSQTQSGTFLTIPPSKSGQKITTNSV